LNIAKIISIKGFIQGVGFRQYIYRLATQLSICGWEELRSDLLAVKIEGTAEKVGEFLHRLPLEAPKPSSIAKIDTEDAFVEGYDTFIVKERPHKENLLAYISPDIAVCENCLLDIIHKSHLIDYPLTNCANCGPRYSIIKNLPYSRANTTMNSFEMCETCQSEYTEISNHRFHAQPIACNNCGPKYTLIHNNYRYFKIDDIITKSAFLIDDGNILTIKGIGGFFITCDANNETAVQSLRKNISYKPKPYAVMFSSVEILKKYAHLSSTEATEIASWRGTILLVRQRKHLAYSVNNGFDKIAAILPYMPIHYLLFAKIYIKYHL